MKEYAHNNFDILIWLDDGNEAWPKEWINEGKEDGSYYYSFSSLQRRGNFPSSMGCDYLPYNFVTSQIMRCDALLFPLAKETIASDELIIAVGIAIAYYKRIFFLWYPENSAKHLISGLFFENLKGDFNEIFQFKSCLWIDFPPTNEDLDTMHRLQERDTKFFIRCRNFYTYQYKSDRYLIERMLQALHPELTFPELELPKFFDGDQPIITPKSKNKK